MNFKLSRQQVLPMVLLIAGVLFAIYLLKSTLEGAVAVNCKLPSAKYEQCKNDTKTLTEFCNHNPEVPTLEATQHGVIAKINPCFDLAKDGTDIAMKYCHNNPKAPYDLCQTYPQTLLSYCSGNSQATPSQCVTCDLCTPETRQAFCSTSSHADTDYCSIEGSAIEYCSNNPKATAAKCRKLDRSLCNNKSCSRYYCANNAKELSPSCGDSHRRFELDHLEYCSSNKNATPCECYYIWTLNEYCQNPNIIKKEAQKQLCDIAEAERAKGPYVYLDEYIKEDDGVCQVLPSKPSKPEIL